MAMRNLPYKTRLELVAEIKAEAAARQQRQEERLKEMESRGQEHLKTFRAIVGKANAEILHKLEDASAEEAKKAKTYIKGVRAHLLAAESPKDQLSFADEQAYGFGLDEALAMTPDEGQILIPGSPYQDIRNPGLLRAAVNTSGDGSGIAGTGENSTTAYMYWWFHFIPDHTASYGYTINIPFNGFYVVYSDDGTWDSKEAAVSLDVYVSSWQYNWKNYSTTNILAFDSQNIDVNDRLDGVRTLYYSNLLAGGDPAELLLTIVFSVKARGDGSYAELNFSEGNANHVGVPWAVITG